MIIDARGQAAGTSRANVAAGDQAKEVERLKKDLGKHLPLAIGYTLVISIHFLDALKTQAKSQAAEYDRLADQYNKETGKPVSDKRKD
jgi:B-cell receptor-associated protein 31